MRGGGRAVVVVRAGAGPGWWSGRWAVGGGRGAVRQERMGANIVYKTYWLYM